MPRRKATGLPKDEEVKLRVDALLDTAAEVFFESGFEAASTTEIARRARASKQSFYARYPTKEKLFLAVIDREMERMATNFDNILDDRLPLKEVLQNVARNYYEVVLGKEHLALLRIVYMEAVRFPQIGQAFFKFGPERVMTSLATFLSKEMKAGRLRQENPETAAEHFLALVRGHSLHRALLGIPQPYAKKDRPVLMHKAVDTFMAKHAI